ncbi:hypothetical protein NUACC26_054810 [Scytonema sp. NUACC26]
MRLLLIISIFLALLLGWNAPVVPLPVTVVQAQPVQSVNFTKANSFELSGASIEVQGNCTSIRISFSQSCYALY